jgi:hypothetical protein
MKKNSKEYSVYWKYSAVASGHSEDKDHEVVVKNRTSLYTV